MEELMLVTGYKDICFKDANDKEIDMIKITCFSKNPGADSVGFLPLQLVYQGQQKKEVGRALTRVPGLYRAKYSMIPGKNNKPTLEITDFEFAKEVDFNSLFKNEK